VTPEQASKAVAALLNSAVAALAASNTCTAATVLQPELCFAHFTCFTAFAATALQQ
jgi:hypothetical protein